MKQAQPQPKKEGSGQAGESRPLVPPSMSNFDADDYEDTYEGETGEEEGKQRKK